MSPEAQQIAILEALGWTQPNPPTQTGWMHPLNSFELKPDFLHDLNEMHEAEKILKPHQWKIYSNKLMVALCDSDPTLDRSNIEARYKSAHATAAQRCEAFLKALGKWVDDK